jgi:choline-glycine betaine transporter
MTVAVPLTVILVLMAWSLLRGVAAEAPRDRPRRRAAGEDRDTSAEAEGV